LKKRGNTYDLYLDFVKDYEDEKKKVAEELENGSKGVSNPELCVNFAVNYSTKLAPMWSPASYSNQQKLQFLLFPKGIFYNRAEDRCRTTGINEAFAYIAELERLLQKCKSRTSQKKFDSAALVVPTRIELVSKV
jgi:site-specific DNA recombinase